MWENNLYTVKWKEKGGNVVTFENLDLLDSIGSLNEKLDPKQSAINTATLDFDITNMEDRFSTFLYGKLSTTGKTFFRELVEVYKGTTIIFKGFVRSIKVKDPYEMKYSITLETVIGKLKTSLWEREFSEYLTETVAHINATRLAPGFSMITRTNDRGEVYRVITYSGHIMDCMKGVLQMALSQPSITVNSLFLDTNYTNFLDVAVWQSIKDSLSSQIYTSYFEWTEPIGNIFDFLQRQIFMVIGVVPVVDNLGRIKMVINQQPTESEGVKKLTHNEILKFNSKKIDESQVVNNLKMKYQKIDDEYTKAMVKINSGSFAFFGNELIPEKPQEMEIDSINNLSRADQLTFMSNISDLLFSRFSRELNIIDLKLPIQKGFEVNLGEFIQIDTELLIDWETGKRGLNPLLDGTGLIAKFNMDKWGGFVQGNSLGVAPDGTVIIDTSEPRIWIDVFKVQCVANHNKIKQWVINNV